MSATKIIGLAYQNETYYAMFINIAAFEAPEEVQVLGEQAGIPAARAGKYLFAAPLDRSAAAGELLFSNRPDEFEPRAPYLLAFPFVRDYWTKIASGDILDVDALTRCGPSGWDRRLADFIVKLPGSAGETV